MRYVLLLLLALTACQSNPEQSAQTADSTTSVAADQPARAAGTTGSVAPNDYVIIPGERVGPITRTTTLAQLTNQLGQENVVAQDTIFLGEGEPQPVTTLFKGTSEQAHIVWQGTVPGEVLIRPDTTGAQRRSARRPSLWRTRSGLTIGTTLREAERINGRGLTNPPAEGRRRAERKRPFTLYGFAWDYGGTVASWQGGTLGTGRVGGQAALSVRFGLPPSLTPAEKKRYRQVMGDAPFSSALPAMQQLNPVVQTITVTLNTSRSGR